jgi:hypothetical protein
MCSVCSWISYSELEDLHGVKFDHNRLAVEGAMSIPQQRESAVGSAQSASITGEHTAAYAVMLPLQKVMLVAAPLCKVPRPTYCTRVRVNTAGCSQCTCGRPW